MPSTADYTWRGPLDSLTLTNPDGSVAWSGIAAPGKTLRGLPSDHPQVRSLIDLGHLAPPARATNAPSRSASLAVAMETTNG